MAWSSLDGAFVNAGVRDLDEIAVEGHVLSGVRWRDRRVPERPVRCTANQSSTARSSR